MLEALLASALLRRQQMLRGHSQLGGLPVTVEQVARAIEADLSVARRHPHENTETVVVAATAIRDPPTNHQECARYSTDN